MRIKGFDKEESKGLKMASNSGNEIHRYAFFLPSLCGGGAERVTLTLVNGMASQGIPVDLVLASSHGPYLIDVHPGVRIVDLKSRRVSTSIFAYWRYLRQSKPKAIVSSLTHANIVTVLASWASLTNTRVYLVEHSTHSISTENSENVLDRFMTPLMRVLYPCADGVIAVSAGVASDLSREIRIPLGDISVIYNPVLTPQLLACAEVKGDGPWKKEDSLPRIIAVGRLSKQKNFSLLLNAFAALKKRIDCRLVILGEGELRQDLENEANSLGVAASISMPGFVKNPYVWMKNSDLFVLSSAWEGLPTVLIEAMACGLPVVSTDCPSGPSEILEYGKWGVLVPVNDINQLADAMFSALSKRGHCDTSRRAANFDVKTAVDSYMRVISA
jgi:glycosyltransferase involved in cell wall biosynthesis